MNPPDYQNNWGSPPDVEMIGGGSQNNWGFSPNGSSTSSTASSFSSMYSSSRTSSDTEHRGGRGQAPDGGGGPAPGGGGGGPIHVLQMWAPAPGGLPFFTGGWRYDPQNPFTYFSALGHPMPNNFHGLQIPAPDGMGLPVDPQNIAYNCGGFYDPTWVRPLIGRRNGAGHPIGVKLIRANQCNNQQKCLICGFLFVERQPYYLLQPTELMAHYPCFLSQCRIYDYCRYQACISLQAVPLMRWAVSSNIHQRPPGAPLNWTTMTHVEVMDLYVALKLSGYILPMPAPLPPINGAGINWDRVLSFAPVLRCYGKTAARIRESWRNQRQHVARCLTPGFVMDVVPANLLNHLP